MLPLFRVCFYVIFPRASLVLIGCLLMTSCEWTGNACSCMGSLHDCSHLGSEIPQRRSFSVHIFNALLCWLKDEIVAAAPVVFCGWLPGLARDAMLEAAARCPPSDFSSPPSVRARFAVDFENVLGIFGGDSYPWHQSHSVFSAMSATHLIRQTGLC